MSKGQRPATNSLHVTEDPLLHSAVSNPAKYFASDSSEPTQKCVINSFRSLGVDTTRDRTLSNARTLPAIATRYFCGRNWKIPQDRVLYVSDLGMLRSLLTQLVMSEERRLPQSLPGAKGGGRG